MVQPIGYDGRPIPTQPKVNRVRPNFSNLFQGMPSLNDIVGGTTENNDDDYDDDDHVITGSDATNSNSLQSTLGRPKRRRYSANDSVDETWFDKERQQIRNKYDTFLNDMLQQISSERKNDPDSVPSNAEELIKSVLKQEMEQEIVRMKDQRIQEQFLSYDTDTRSKSDNIDISNVSPNPTLQRLMDESEAEYVKQSSNRNALQDFLQYQATITKSQQQQQQQQSTTPKSQPQTPKIGENLDQWALDRLKDMINSRKGADDDEMILDILQENADQLENDLLIESGKLSISSDTPKTMKEWQMYRSIASRMEDDVNNNTISLQDRDDQIIERLNSWKDYLVKEEGNRKQSGLSRGPKLPFPWQESLLEATKMQELVIDKDMDKASRIESRKKLNRMSIDAMESLLLKTDPIRREKLQKEIDYLKATLEANDYLDVDESVFDDEVSATNTNDPVNTTNLFFSNWSDDDSTDNLSAWDTSQQPSSMISSSSPPPINTDFGENEPRRNIPPPNTAFFTDNLDDEEYDLGETLTGDSKLGTMDEQKLESMYRRAGARTPEERKAIQSQWEEFRQLELRKRQQSGLSGDSATIGSEIKYNISEVMKDDGDFDAAKILATIGPRPARTKKDSKSPATEDNDPIPPSSVKEEEVLDSLFRSVSAIGGGRYKDDPIAKQQERSSFEEFVLKESKMRESLDDPTLSSQTTLKDLQLPEPSDDVNYAKEVLSSMGPRPKPKRTKVVDARQISDQGGILSSDDTLADDEYDNEDDDDDEDEDDDIDGTKSTSIKNTFDIVPEWLRKENEEAMKGKGIVKSMSGNDIDLLFDNDKYEHNMRQLAEYEKRRSGGSRSMGIDISDVLGRRDTDDYADFKYDDDYYRSRQSDSWTMANFAARKANLLEYIELDIREINALMDHKDSVYSTGVSQYLPRINKPFKEFGAIFRLEGVILDVIGLQLQAWNKVADEYGFKRPMHEDVKLASVTRPETAVKDIFAWSDNFLECRNIAASHRRIFKQVFGSWAVAEGISLSVSPVQDYVPQSFIFDRGTESQPIKLHTVVSESDKLKQMAKAWTETAAEHGKDPPDKNALLIASTLSPDIAIVKVFKWTLNPIEIDRITATYRLYLVPEKKREVILLNESATSIRGDSIQTQAEVMELHYKAWSDVAISYGFDPPAADEVLAAFVINEPEIAARGFGWSDDNQKLLNIAKDFRLKLQEYLKLPMTTQPELSTDVSHSQPLKGSDAAQGNDPNREELFQIAYNAWSETARANGFPEPDVDQVQFALSVGPEEAIVTGFEWTTKPAEIVNLLRSYRDAIGRIRGVKSTKPVEKPQPNHKGPNGPSQDDLYRTVFDSWTAVAKESGYPLPDDEQVLFALSVGAEEAILNGFGWTNDPNKVAELMGRYKAEIAKRRSSWQRGDSTKTQTNHVQDDVPMYKVRPGVSRWIKSLLDVEMQCAVVSYLDRDQVDTLLELSGISEMITADKRVSASNGYVTDTDMLLGAALRVERRPDHCVVFDTTPHSSVAAHEVEMQSVCIIGPYPRYELLSADTTAASFDSLSAINVRRLFGERVYDQPQVEFQAADPAKSRNTRTRFYDDE
jgi:beta-phosphoglucomutase-like phosphatase (HAD superfamily)